MLMSNEHRDLGLEMKLQYAMDNGMGVWVLGDIHGHIDTLKELISRINLEDGDQLVSLGDMIDRGPDSASVLGMFRENPSFHAVKGNHEQLMHKSISIGKNKHWKSWLKYGGIETMASFGFTRDDGDLLDLEWSSYLSNLPSEIVLDRFRLVHAGYDPDAPMDQQREHDRLWSRGLFQSASVMDKERQIIVGHTPVQEIEGHDGNAPWYSDILLEDGRPAVVGIETGICLGLDLNPTLTAIELVTGEVVQAPRLDRA